MSRRRYSSRSSRSRRHSSHGSRAGLFFAVLLCLVGLGCVSTVSVVPDGLVGAFAVIVIVLAFAASTSRRRH